MHDTGQDGHGPHGDVSSIAEQAGVKADVQDALGKLHDKGSDAQGDAGEDDRAPQTGVPELQPQCGCFPGEEAENPGAGNPLGENGGQGGALHAHSQGEDENRVQNNVAGCADGHGEHSGSGKALGVDESVETQSKLDEQGTQGVYFHVVPGVGDGVAAGAENHQNVLAETLDHHCENQGGDHQHGGAVAQNALGLLGLSLAHHDGGTGRAPHAHQGSKGGNAHDQRQGHPHAGQRVGADIGNVADVHPVHHIVEQVDELGQNGRQGQLEEKAADFVLAQIGALRML